LISVDMTWIKLFHGIIKNTGECHSKWKRKVRFDNKHKALSKVMNLSTSWMSNFVAALSRWAVQLRFRFA
jgi:hypothetical protein